MELPSFIWDKNSKNIDVSLEWSILDKVDEIDEVF